MKNKGFTLIELMIVVAIIAIIAVIAIPNLLESRKVSNETSAIGSLRTIVTAQQQFRILRKKTANNRPQYGNFSELNSHEMVDAAFVNGYKSGYNFTMDNSLASNTNFTVHASPVSESDGTRIFFTNNGGRVTFATTALPTATSTGVE